MAIKRIGILTSGGDGPGMNAAIRSAVRYALSRGVEPMGIFRGFEGLIHEDLQILNHRSVSNIINRGGTILKTARSKAFLTKAGRRVAYETVKKYKIDGLVLIGGNGTYTGGNIFVKEWKVPCIGVPGTIDNDINGTDSTIGADTAVNTALDAIDKIRDTATSMERIFVVEVMGRSSGFIATEVAIGGGAEEVLVPDRRFDIDEVCGRIVEGNLCGKVSWIIVVAEGAGKAADIAGSITKKTKLETRVVVLGHVQRGGVPTANDRKLATRLGAKAVELLLRGERRKAVGISGEGYSVVDLAVAIRKKHQHHQELYQLLRVLT